MASLPERRAGMSAAVVRVDAVARGGVDRRAARRAPLKTFAVLFAPGPSPALVELRGTVVGEVRVVCALRSGGGWPER